MKKKGRKFKRIICCILCCILLVGTTVNVYANSYSVSYAKILPFKTVNLSGYKYYSGYKATTRMKGTLYNMNKIDPDPLDIYQTVKFIGTTGGTYATTKGKKPSKIVQTDTVKATGVSVGVSLSSKSASIKLSGTSKTKTYEYTVSNKYGINNSVSYVVQGVALTSVTVTTSTKYTWNTTGKTVYVVPGDSQ